MENPSLESRYIRLQAILLDYQSMQRVTELRIEKLRRTEECQMALATALLVLKHDYLMTWQQIASEIDGISDNSQALRLSKRQGNIGRIGYELAAQSINKFISNRGGQTINFPAFPMN